MKRAGGATTSSQRRLPTCPITGYPYPSVAPQSFAESIQIPQDTSHEIQQGPFASFTYFIDCCLRLHLGIPGTRARHTFGDFAWPHPFTERRERSMAVSRIHGRLQHAPESTRVFANMLYSAFQARMHGSTMG